MGLKKDRNDRSIRTILMYIYDLICWTATIASAQDFIRLHNVIHLVAFVALDNCSAVWSSLLHRMANEYCWEGSAVLFDVEGVSLLGIISTVLIEDDTWRRGDKEDCIGSRVLVSLEGSSDDLLILSGRYELVAKPTKRIMLCNGKMHFLFVYY